MAELYARYSSLVWSVAYRVTQRSYGADETTQEVFLGVWNLPCRFDPSRGSMRGWLSVLARHRSVDWLRHEVAVHRRELSAMEERRFQVPADDAVTAREDVLKALDRLSTSERDPIVLAHFGGLTYREVAIELGIPEGTAKSRIRSGLNRLANLLEDREDHATVLPGRCRPAGIADEVANARSEPNRGNLRTIGS